MNKNKMTHGSNIEKGNLQMYLNFTLVYVVSKWQEFIM